MGHAEAVLCATEINYGTDSAMSGACPCLSEILHVAGTFQAGVLQHPWPLLRSLRGSACPLQAQASRSLSRTLSGTFIHTPMWQKLAPLALIFFCATFNHTLLVNMKVRHAMLRAMHEDLGSLAPTADGDVRRLTSSSRIASQWSCSS